MTSLIVLMLLAYGLSLPCYIARMHNAPKESPQTLSSMQRKETVET